MENITFGTALLALITFIAKEIYDYIKEQKKSYDTADKEHLEAIQANTEAITRLIVKVEYLEEAFKDVKDFRKDFYVMMAKFNDDPYRPDQ